MIIYRPFILAYSSQSLSSSSVAVDSAALFDKGTGGGIIAETLFIAELTSNPPSVVLLPDIPFRLIASLLCKSAIRSLPTLTC